MQHVEHHDKHPKLRLLTLRDGASNLVNECMVLAFQKRKMELLTKFRNGVTFLAKDSSAEH